MDKLLGLPPLASEHGRHVDDLIIYVHLLMLVLFVGWSAYFVYVLFRFRRSRNPKADYIGVKNHSSTWIEGAVAAIEGVLLIFVAVPMWAKAMNAPKPEEASAVLHVAAQQFDWNIRYPGTDGLFGKQDMKLVSMTNTFGVDMEDPNAKDDVQDSTQIHVPLVKNPDGSLKPIVMYITSRDVIHSFKIIAMRVTQDAIPGMRIPIHFTPTQLGKYQINCAQLCGNAHSGMSRGMLIVESEEDFKKWLASKAGSSSAVDYQ